MRNTQNVKNTQNNAESIGATELQIRQKEIYQERAIVYLKTAEQMLVNAGYEMNGLGKGLGNKYQDLKLNLTNFRLAVQDLDLRNEVSA